MGVALEVGVVLATGRREAWDAAVYWSTGVPLALVGAAAIGYLSRGRAWLAPLAIVPAQVVAMMYRNGAMGNLWPITLALSSVLSLPFVGVAFAARRLRRRT